MQLALRYDDADTVEKGIEQLDALKEQAKAMLGGIPDEMAELKSMAETLLKAIEYEQPDEFLIVKIELDEDNVTSLATLVKTL